MRRKDPLCHLRAQGCELLREGGRHSIYWNPATRMTSAVPRHSEIVEPVAIRICKDLGIPRPGAGQHPPRRNSRSLDVRDLAVHEDDIHVLVDPRELRREVNRFLRRAQDRFDLFGGLAPRYRLRRCCRVGRRPKGGIQRRGDFAGADIAGGLLVERNDDNTCELRRADRSLEEDLLFHLGARGRPGWHRRGRQAHLFPHREQLARDFPFRLMV